MEFNELGLLAELLRAIDESGYRNATPIQQQAIPPILEGRDVLATAQTGTGKTAGFMLPLLQRLHKSQDKKQDKRPRALILAPTRELTAQIAESAKTYGRHVSVRSTMIFGGVSIRPQFEALRRGVDIVIATPGRLLDHLQQGTVNLGAVEVLVLDEADRMLDMGFIRDIRKIMQRLPKERQNLLFSATFSNDIRSLAQDILRNPVEIAVAPNNSTADRVQQVVYPVDRERKRELLAHQIGQKNWQQVLVFTRTKHGADRLAKQLEQDGLHSTAIHGRKTQGARTRALADFKAGRVRVLVATDVAARGLDIDRLPHVVNYELPDVPEDYVHRIGRTARAGEAGHAISLVCVDELKLLRDIESLLKRKIEREIVPGYEVDPRIKAEPIQRGGRSRQQGAPGGARTGAPRGGSNAPAGNRGRNGNARPGNSGGRGNPAARSSGGRSGQGQGQSRGASR
jgi:ATP-dependent RNA helicase RhlE